MAINTQLIEGIWQSVLHYHFDIDNDVLYLRLASKMDVETYAEDTEDGYTLLRSLDDDSSVGLVVINYWKRFGIGKLEDASLSTLEQVVASVGKVLPIAA